MNFTELGISAILPLAELKGGINGTRFIAEVTTVGGEKRLLSILPSEYDLSKAIPIEPYILESAVAKHGYDPVEHELLDNEEKYQTYLREINLLEES
jgi:hypothetical protein